ncbi:MAG: hypothetical protein IPM82_09870 [Saprospiraceae bacterium]|nr:hypothetical protein [Saprospiraceae bacterium]
MSDYKTQNSSSKPPTSNLVKSLGQPKQPRHRDIGASMASNAKNPSLS